MSQDNRRQSDRQNLPIEFEFWCDDTRHRGRLEDLSEGGAYVYTGLDWPAGTPIGFSFALPDEDPAPITGNGTVVWTEYMGFGIRFEMLDEATKKRIRAVIGPAS